MKPKPLRVGELRALLAGLSDTSEVSLVMENGDEGIVYEGALRSVSTEPDLDPDVEERGPPFVLLHGRVESFSGR